MCSEPERSKSISSSSLITAEETSNANDLTQMTADANDSLSSLLELAANSEYEAFKELIKTNDSFINESGLWYCRKKGSRKLVHEHRTPLMVSATYGSIEILKLILSYPNINVNKSCGSDQTTALHCAASGGSQNALEASKLLILAGANTNSIDSNGFRPIDIIITPPKSPSLKTLLEELLMNNIFDISRVSIADSLSTSPTLSSSSQEGSPCSPIALSDKKEYPIDPTMPDIKNGIYSSDEFRMFSFKIQPCSRAYSHDWTECPFVHPGENARRRDPRKYHYSCVPCPEFRKNTCRRGDTCEYSHGVFESWLHPAQYRTRLCKDGANCNRKICFFAHFPEELRPLYASTGSGVPSPRSNSPIMSPSLFNQPLSPSGNGVSLSSMGWPQPNVPTLNLPGSNIQSSRLRSSLSARDIISDFDGQQQIFNDLSCLSQNRSNLGSLSRSCLSKSLTPSNLDELFSAEIGSGAFSPSHRSVVSNLNNNNHFQQQQNMLSPINTNLFSPKRQIPFGVISPRHMSPRNLEPLSPMSARLSSFRENHQQQFRSLSSRDLGSKINGPIVGSPTSSWSKWGSPNGIADWSVENMRKSSSFEVNNNENEPDLSWVQSLVKESPPEVREKNIIGPVSGNLSSGEAVKIKTQMESVDHEILGSWLEQMQLDQLVA